jgi:predicted phosphate transport protein (TIGR00153 family)
MTKEKSEKSMRDLFYDNVELLKQGFQAMSGAVIAYCGKDLEKAKLKSEETIMIEKNQDRLREELVKRIFSKETMVFSRPDRLNIVESLDKMLDETEIVVRKLMQYNPEVPENLKSGLEEISINVGKIGIEMQGLIKAVLEDFSQGEQFIEKIQDIRRNVRDRHWELLNNTYKDKLEPIEFFYFHSLIKAVAKVADRAEEFSDEIHGLLCKYAL